MSPLFVPDSFRFVFLVRITRAKLITQYGRIRPPPSWRTQRPGNSCRESHMNRCFKPRTTQLAVNALEDRCTPATAVYAAATQTLTVTAAAGDSIDVAHIAA